MQGLARLNDQPARQSVRGMLPVPTDARLFGGHELLSGLSRASFKSPSSAWPTAPETPRQAMIKLDAPIPSGNEFRRCARIGSQPFARG